MKANLSMNNMKNNSTFHFSSTVFVFNVQIMFPIILLCKYLLGVKGLVASGE